MALVSRPVILRQILAANDDDAGGNSPITVFNPIKKGAIISIGNRMGPSKIKD